MRFARFGTRFGTRFVRFVIRFMRFGFGFGMGFVMRFGMRFAEPEQTLKFCLRFAEFRTWRFRFDEPYDIADPCLALLYTNSQVKTLFIIANHIKIGILIGVFIFYIIFHLQAE